MLIRGFYYEGWNPTKTPVSEHTSGQFLQRVAEHYENNSAADAEDITRAVFRVMERHITPGEIKDVKRSLPESIRELWG